MTNNENFYQKYRQELVPRLVPGAAAADGAKVPNAEAVASVGGRVLSAEEIAAEAEMNAILASDDAPSTSFSNESDESSGLLLFYIQLHCYHFILFLFHIHVIYYVANSL